MKLIIFALAGICLAGCGKTDEASTPAPLMEQDEACRLAMNAPGFVYTNRKTGRTFLRLKNGGEVELFSPCLACLNGTGPCPDPTPAPSPTPI